MPLHDANGPIPHGADHAHDGNVIAYASLLTLSPEDRAAWGVTWVDEPEPEPVPEPRRLLAKSAVHERMNALGKLGAAFAALQSNPIYFGRWFAPDWPNVYFDDEGLLDVLGAIGCTEADIATVTAP
jgi:hypothetical protein